MHRSLSGSNVGRIELAACLFVPVLNIAKILYHTAVSKISSGGEVEQFNAHEKEVPAI